MAEAGLRFGIQLPVQSQSTIYCEHWETEAGPASVSQCSQ